MWWRIVQLTCWPSIERFPFAAWGRVYRNVVYHVELNRVYSTSNGTSGCHVRVSNCMGAVHSRRGTSEPSCCRGILFKQGRYTSVHHQTGVWKWLFDWLLWFCFTNGIHELSWTQRSYADGDASVDVNTVSASWRPCPKSNMRSKMKQPCLHTPLKSSSEPIIVRIEMQCLCIELQLIYWSNEPGFASIVFHIHAECWGFNRHFAPNIEI